jgi:hypothetical protein
MQQVQNNDYKVKFRQLSVLSVGERMQTQCHSNKPGSVEAGYNYLQKAPAQLKEDVQLRMST